MKYSSQPYTCQVSPAKIPDLFLLDLTNTGDQGEVVMPARGFRVWVKPNPDRFNEVGA